MFKLGDTVEIKYPEDWTNSKSLQESIVDIRLKGFMLNCKFFNYPAYTPSRLKRFKLIVLALKGYDYPNHFTDMSVFTSKMVLTEKFNSKLYSALNKGNLQN